MSEKRKKYYTYIIKCADETFYTGYTSDLERRLRSITSAGPDIPGENTVTLVYYEEYWSRSETMKREYALKKLSHREKADLIGQGE